MAATSSSIAQTLAGDEAFFALLRSKNINPLVFQSRDDALGLQSPLEEHARWAYQHIYSQPYPEHCILLVTNIDPEQCSFSELAHHFRHYGRYAIGFYNDELYFINGWKKSITRIDVSTDNQTEYEELKAACSWAKQSHPFILGPFGKGRYAFSSIAYPFIASLTGQQYASRIIYEEPPGYKTGIPRFVHGITHVASVAILISVLENLYRKQGLESELLNDEEIKLLQIAALFHDAAREAEGVDLWDHESALILYYYLRRVLAVGRETAKCIAEATANKDLSDGCSLISMSTAPVQYHPCGLIDLTEHSFVDTCAHLVSEMEISFEEITSHLREKDAIFIYQEHLYYANYEKRTVKVLPAEIKGQQEAFARFKAKITQDYQLAEADDGPLITRLTKKATPFKILEHKLNHKSAILLHNNDLYFADYEGESVEKIPINSENKQNIATLISRFKETRTQADQTELSLIRLIIFGMQRKKGYFYINESDQGLISWGFNTAITRQTFTKNTLQKLIHDADCLDIIRARSHFVPNYLDLYQAILSSLEGSAQQLAIEELSRLIFDVRTLVAMRGDAYVRRNPDKKKHFEQENVVQKLSSIITPDAFPLIFRLFKPRLPVDAMQDLIDLTPFDPTAPLTNENLSLALANFYIYLRGVTNPTEQILVKAHGRENLSGVELRKVFRRPGVPTKSSKPDRFEKNGNPLRSISLVPAGIFADAGFLIIGIDVPAISRVSGRNLVSGRGKKVLESSTRPSIEEIRRQLDSLHHRLKLGGDSVKNGDFIDTHTELLYDITRFHAVYYTNDPTSRNDSLTKAERSSPFLQAAHLKLDYERVYEKVKMDYQTYFGEAGLALFMQHFGEKKSLPLVEYSELHNRIRLVSEAELTDDYLIEQWKKMVAVYIQKQLQNGVHVDRVMNRMPLDLIKISSMYEHATPSGCLLVAMETNLRSIDFDKLSDQVAQRNAVVLFENELFYVSQESQHVFALRVPSEYQDSLDQLKSRITSSFQEADLETCLLINESIQLFNEFISSDEIYPLRVFTAADQYYDEALRTKINEAILAEKQRLITCHETLVIEKYRRSELTFMRKNAYAKSAFQTQRIREELTEMAREYALKTYEQIKDIVSLDWLRYFVEQFDLMDQLQTVHNQSFEKIFFIKLSTVENTIDLYKLLCWVSGKDTITDPLKSIIGARLIELLNRNKIKSLPLFFKMTAMLESRHFLTGGLQEQALFGLLKQIPGWRATDYEQLDNILMAYEKMQLGVAFSDAQLLKIKSTWKGIWRWIWIEMRDNPTHQELIEKGQQILQTRIPIVLGEHFSFRGPKQPYLLSHASKAILMPGMALAGASVAIGLSMFIDKGSLFWELSGRVLKWFITGTVFGAVIGDIIDKEREATFNEPFTTLNSQFKASRDSYQIMAGVLGAAQNVPPADRLLQEQVVYSTPLAASSTDIHETIELREHEHSTQPGPLK